MLWAIGRAHGWRATGATRQHCVELWRIGLPTALQFMLEVGSFVLLAALISSLSETQMAAHQIALQVCQFSFLPAYAVSEAASVLAGQAVGARRQELVLPVAHLCLRVAGAYTLVCSLVFVFVRPAHRGRLHERSDAGGVRGAPALRGGGVPDVRRGQHRGALRSCAASVTCASRRWSAW